MPLPCPPAPPCSPCWTLNPPSVLLSLSSWSTPRVCRTLHPALYPRVCRTLHPVLYPRVCRTLHPALHPRVCRTLHPALHPRVCRTLHPALYPGSHSSPASQMLAGPLKVYMQLSLIDEMQGAKVCGHVSGPRGYAYPPRPMPSTHPHPTPSPALPPVGMCQDIGSMHPPPPPTHTHTTSPHPYPTHPAPAPAPRGCISPPPPPPHGTSSPLSSMLSLTPPCAVLLHAGWPGALPLPHSQAARPPLTPCGHSSS